jgi:hypothetical protein
VNGLGISEFWGEQEDHERCWEIIGRWDMLGDEVGDGAVLWVLIINVHTMRPI